MKRFLIPFTALIVGFLSMAAIYFGILIWAQGWDYALSQFLRNRQYVLPIFSVFGIQAALYSILRFRLFIPTRSTSRMGILMGTNGGASVTALIVCCLHHITDAVPILGLSAAATFLTRYQRPFLLASLDLNLLGMIVMLAILYRAFQKLPPSQKKQPALETE